MATLMFFVSNKIICYQLLFLKACSGNLTVSCCLEALASLSNQFDVTKYGAVWS